MYQSNEIKIYDGGEKCIDRFSVVYLNSLDRETGLYECRTMSAHPFHPMGFCQMTLVKPGKHLGKPTPFTELPVDCQKVITRDYRLETDQYNLFT